MEMSATNVSIDDSDMGKIILEPRHENNVERPVGGEASWKMAKQLLPPSQEEEEKEPKRKSTDSASSSSSSSSSLSDRGEIENEEDSEDRKDNRDDQEKEQRANAISQSEQRLLDKLSKAIRHRNDHGACMVALASRISESTIGHTHNQNNHPNNESQSMHRNKRARYQRRNSFVIHRNPGQQHPPPSLLQQQEEEDLQESMHQSSPAFFHPADPRPSVIHPTLQPPSPQDHKVSDQTMSTTQQQQQAWGNASWSNSNDTERYHSFAASTSLGSPKRVIPMPTPPKGGYSGVAVDPEHEFPFPALPPSSSSSSEWQRWKDKNEDLFRGN